MSLVQQLATSSTVAWSPIHKDQLAFASLEGLTDVDFDSTSKLSIVRSLNGTTVGQTVLNDKVTCLSWGCQTRTNGIIAAGYSNGSIGFYDPTEIYNGNNGEISLLNKTGVVNTIDFNPKESILASGSDKGEVLIWNVKDPSIPEVYTPGTSITDSISCLKWNIFAPFILGVATHNGKISVWDLRNKRGVVQFTDKAGRLSQCRSISWHPTNPMVLITASADDKYPNIQLWNIKNSHYPVKTFEGHTKGILSTSWNNTDTRFLLSSGNDNKVICWDVDAGIAAEEIVVPSDYNFQVQWAPNLPSLFSLSSSSGVQVYSLHDVQTSSEPPKWIKKSSGASFGFGGKVVSSSGCENNQLVVERTPVQEEILDSISQFETILNINNFEGYCETKANTCDNEDRETWIFLQAAVSQNKTKFLLNHLGFSEQQLEEALSHIQAEKEEIVEQIAEERIDDSLNVNPFAQEKKSDVSDLFASENFENFGDYGDFGFGNNFERSLDSENTEKEEISSDKRQISIIELASQMGEPFEFFTKKSTSADQTISRLIIVGNFSGAIDACFKLNRVSDALAIAVVSNDQKLIGETLNRFFSAKDNQPYIKLVSFISKKHLKQLIASSNIDDWKLTLATICAHSSDQEFEDLANNLGELLEFSGRFHAASLCYTVARNIEKTTEIWLKNSTLDLKYLFAIIEKSTIFQQINPSGGSKSLIEYYRKYAELLCSQGKLDIALKFLNSLGENIHHSPQAVDLRDRISNSPSSSSSSSYERGFAFGEENPNNSNSRDLSLFDSYQDDSFSNISDPPVDPFSAPNSNFGLNAFHQQQPAPVQSFVPQPAPVQPVQPAPIQSFVPQPAPVQPAPIQSFVPQPIQPVVPQPFGVQPVAPQNYSNPFGVSSNPFLNPNDGNRGLQGAIPAVEPFPDSNAKISPLPQNNTPDLINQYKEAITTLKSRLQKNDPVYKNLENLEGRLSSLEKPLKEKKISQSTIDVLSSIAGGIQSGMIASVQSEFNQAKTIYESGNLEIPGSFWLGLKKFF